MAKEVLAVSEEDLPAVIAIIRAGMDATDTPDHVREALTEWCDEEEAYLER